MVSDAFTYVPSRPSLSSGNTSGLLACPGVSFCVLGSKVRSLGALPMGRVWAEKVGAAALPCSAPTACCAKVSGALHEVLGKAYAVSGHGLVAGFAGAKGALACE